MNRRIFPLVIVIIGLFEVPGIAKVEPEWARTLPADLERMAQRLNETVRAWDVPPRTFDVADYGAVADGKTVCTTAIQQAIDVCHRSGGGVVLLSRGDFVTGTIDLKSGVMLEVARGARLLGSTSMDDYPDRIATRPTVMDSNMNQRHSLIFAQGCDRVGIRGAGIIDGRGTQENFPGKQTVGPVPGRPFLIRMLDCTNVVIQDIALRDAASWMQNYLNCDKLLVERITVDNQANWNNDGLDIDGCRNVVVRHCLINSEDDALCFKGASMRPTEDVLVENCRIYSTCNAIKFGTDSQGDFRRVLIRDAEIGGPPAHMRAITRRRASSGVSWETVDGGVVEDVWMSRVRIDRADSPIFLRLAHRARTMNGLPKPPPGVMQRIGFEGIRGSNNGSRGSFFSGIPGHRIRDILLRDVKLEVAGGSGAGRASASVPENIAGYPDAHQFGKLMPAFGLWMRHTEDCHLIGVEFIAKQPDVRPMLLCDPETESVTIDGRDVPVDKPR